MATLPDDSIEEIECPVCTKVMVPPINQCVNNHNICQSCRPKLKHCHLCRGQITMARNFDAEVLSKSIRHPCKFQESGCPEQYFLDLKGQHESTCIYRHRKCPIVDCSADVVPAEIKKHIEMEHAGEISDSEVIEKTPSGYDPDFILAHEHLSRAPMTLAVDGPLNSHSLSLSRILRLWRDKSGCMFIWYASPVAVGFLMCAAFVGTLEEAKKYKYKITLSSLKSVAMMTACYRCPSYLEIIEKGGIENMTCSVLVPQNLLDECKDSNGKYCIQHEIIKIRNSK